MKTTSNNIEKSAGLIDLILKGKKFTTELGNVWTTGNRAGRITSPRASEILGDAKATTLNELSGIAKDPQALAEMAGLIGRKTRDSGLLPKMLTPKNNEVLVIPKKTAIAAGLIGTGVGGAALTAALMRRPKVQEVEVPVMYDPYMMKQSSLEKSAGPANWLLNSIAGFKNFKTELGNVLRTGNRQGYIPQPTFKDLAQEAKTALIKEMLSNAKNNFKGGILPISIESPVPAGSVILPKKAIIAGLVGAGGLGAGTSYLALKKKAELIKESSIVDKLISTGKGTVGSKLSAWKNAWGNASAIKNNAALKGAAGGAAVGGGAGYLSTGDAKGAVAGAAAGGALGAAGGYAVAAKNVKALRGESLRAGGAALLAGGAVAGASKALTSKAAKDLASKEGFGFLNKVIAKNQEGRDLVKGVKDSVVSGFKSDGIEGAVASGRAAVDDIKFQNKTKGYEEGQAKLEGVGNWFKRKFGNGGTANVKYNPKTGESYREFDKKVVDEVTGKKVSVTVRQQGKMERGTFRGGNEQILKKAEFMGFLMNPNGFEKSAFVKTIMNIGKSTFNSNAMVMPTALKGAAGGAAVGGAMGFAGSGDASGAMRGALAGGALGAGGGAYAGAKLGKAYSFIGKTTGTALLGGSAWKLGKNVDMNRLQGLAKGMFNTSMRGYERGGIKGAWDAAKTYGKAVRNTYANKAAKTAAPKAATPAAGAAPAAGTAAPTVAQGQRMKVINPQTPVAAPVAAPIAPAATVRKVSNPSTGGLKPFKAPSAFQVQTVTPEDVGRGVNRAAAKQNAINNVTKGKGKIAVTM